MCSWPATLQALCTAVLNTAETLFTWDVDVVADKYSLQLWGRGKLADDGAQVTALSIKHAVRIKTLGLFCDRQPVVRAKVRAASKLCGSFGLAVSEKKTGTNALSTAKYFRQTSFDRDRADRRYA